GGRCGRRRGGRLRGLCGHAPRGASISARRRGRSGRRRGRPGRPAGRGRGASATGSGWGLGAGRGRLRAGDGRGGGQASRRNVRTIAENLEARSRMRAKSPAATAFGSTSEPPTPRQQAPALRKASAVFRSTPPVGISLTWGRGPRRALRYGGPPTSAGKTF